MTVYHETRVNDSIITCNLDDLVDTRISQYVFRIVNTILFNDVNILIILSGIFNT
jgi:hypothetical protein